MDRSTWRLLPLLTLAVAAPAGAAEVDHAREEVAQHTAHVLEWGEVSVGTGGIAVGVLPRVQFGFKPLPAAFGLWSGGLRVAVVDTDIVDATLTTAGTTSTMQGLRVGVLGGGAATSVRVSRLELHGGLSYTRIHAEGFPSGPEWLLPGADPLEDVSDGLADANIVPVVDGALTRIRAATEVRVVGPVSVLAQASHTWTTVDATLAPDQLSDELVELSPAIGLAPVWVVSASLQLALGPIHLRGGFGASNLTLGWIPQANAAQIRIGQHRAERRRRALEADGVVDEDGGDGDADGEVELDERDGGDGGHPDRSPAGADAWR